MFRRRVKFLVVRPVMMKEESRTSWDSTCTKHRWRQQGRWWVHLFSRTPEAEAGIWPYVQSYPRLRSSYENHTANLSQEPSKQKARGGPQRNVCQVSWLQASVHRWGDFSLRTGTWAASTWPAAVHCGGRKDNQGNSTHSGIFLAAV